MDIEKLNKQAQQAKQRGDYARFWELRRRYLLAQAKRYRSVPPASVARRGG